MNLYQLQKKLIILIEFEKKINEMIEKNEKEFIYIESEPFKLIEIREILENVMYSNIKIIDKNTIEQINKFSEYYINNMKK